MYNIPPSATRPGIQLIETLIQTNNNKPVLSTTTGFITFWLLGCTQDFIFSLEKKLNFCFPLQSEHSVICYVWNFNENDWMKANPKKKMQKYHRLIDNNWTLTFTAYSKKKRKNRTTKFLFPNCHQHFHDSFNLKFYQTIPFRSLHQLFFITHDQLTPNKKLPFPLLFFCSLHFTGFDFTALRMWHHKYLREFVINSLYCKLLHFITYDFMNHT